MNPSIKKLADTSKKRIRKIIGLMSGTSLDGLDIALCEISDSGAATHLRVKNFMTVPYSPETRDKLKRISSVETVRLKEICYWHTRLADLHATMILRALGDWEIKPGDVDCIASHGQTVYHYPERDQNKINPAVNSTLQIGDGDRIAAKTGILTISDFRQKHTAFGGEGAPMAGLVDRILFSHPTENRILLNIGGIANFTYLPAKKKSGEKSFTTDTGPGNTLIDSLSMNYFQQPYDRDGEIAFSGNPDEKLLDALLNDNWFHEMESKTTGPEYFSIHWFERKIQDAGLDQNQNKIQPESLIRTASELTARTIAKNIRSHADEEELPAVYVSGGGAHNPFLLKRIRELLPRFQVRSIAEIGLSADAKEAVLFAVLANEMLAGDGFEMETNDGKKTTVNFGKISFPG